MRQEEAAKERKEDALTYPILEPLREKAKYIVPLRLGRLHSTNTAEPLTVSRPAIRTGSKLATGSHVLNLILPQLG